MATKNIFVEMAMKSALSDFLDEVQEQHFKINYDKKIEKLRKAHSDLQITYPFQVGDIIIWKKGLQYLKHNGPFIIVEILKDTIIFDDAKSSLSLYFQEFDAIALHIDESGDAMRIPISLNRFQPYVDETENTKDEPVE